MPQKPTKTHINPQQEAFLLAYLSKPTLVEACASAGISAETARRWLKQEHVRAACDDMRQKLLNDSLSALIIHTKTAIETLARNMGEDAPPGVQIRAAQIILEKAIENGKMSDLEARIEELKQMIGERTA